MSKIVVVGAGKTGRGFIARLLQEASEEVIFIDKNVELVEALNKEKEFKVSFFGNVRESYYVHNFKACTWETANLEDAELILVSVGGQNLKDVGASLAPLFNIVSSILFVVIIPPWQFISTMSSAVKLRGPFITDTRTSSISSFSS